jgi:PAT family beta-lactamase induction signal transducer AmpG
VDAFGYIDFFTATAMLGMPVLLLVWLAGRVKLVGDSSDYENTNK